MAGGRRASYASRRKLESERANGAVFIGPDGGMRLLKPVSRLTNGRAALDHDFLMEKVTQACRHYGKVPTFTELSLYRRQVDPDFPSPKTVNAHFRRGEMLARL